VSRQFDIAVLGGGPAGLVSALAASQQARTVLVLDRLSSTQASLRIDSVPARTLALLVELGIDPRALGADRLHNGRWSSWDAAEPVWRMGAQTAHIERPRLEQALFEAVRAAGLVTVLVDGMRPRWTKGFSGNGWRAQNLIDATGRAAVTARTRKRPARPWASRFFWTARGKIAPEFRMAALPCGYAYRLGSAGHIGLGIAGRGRWLNADPSALERLLRDEAADWLLDGMPPIASMTRGASGTCSLQWAGGGRGIPIGDAALARDSLSSQGLAASISDALYAVAAIASGDVAALRERHKANYASHIHHVTELVGRCRFRETPLWRDYETFLMQAASRQTATSYPVLRDGRVVEGARPERVPPINLARP
jgi:2-polyprenyl-6-methoxyphenol hydroxylase-like FAD-dependent oxidoreductase